MEKELRQITLRGSVAEEYGYDGTYQDFGRVMEQLSHLEEKIRRPKYLYLHDNNYLHFYTKSSGPDAAIYVENMINKLSPGYDGPLLYWRDGHHVLL